jgi:hypothetical protein
MSPSNQGLSLERTNPGAIMRVIQHRMLKYRLIVDVSIRESMQVNLDT